MESHTQTCCRLSKDQSQGPTPAYNALLIKYSLPLFKSLTCSRLYFRKREQVVSFLTTFTRSWWQSLTSGVSKRGSVRHYSLVHVDWKRCWAAQTLRLHCAAADASRSASCFTRALSYKPPSSNKIMNLRIQPCKHLIHIFFYTVYVA